MKPVFSQRKSPQNFFMKLNRASFLLILLLIVALLPSCKKKSMLTQGGLVHFSADTLLFDTVFTSVGSATYKIKIYNDEDQPVTLSSVRLKGGASSPFNLNVNGVSGNEVVNQRLAAHDSMYVYSTVTIDPNSDLSPFVVEDQLIATLNGTDFSVPVIAFGQNARYIYDTIGTETWDNRLPYVILNDPNVTKGSVLTIEAGARIYVHPNSRFFVEGTLIINGTKNDSVVFQSDRIDRSYFSYWDLPGEWGGIYFTSDSRNNHLRWAIIKNGGASTTLTFNSGNTAYIQPAAVQVDNNPLLSSPDQGVVLENCSIQNAFGYGLLSFGGKVKMLNSQITTCGSQNVGVFQGGNVDFAQCTFVNYGSRWVNHTEAPVISLLNYLDTSNTGYIPGDLKARVRNCIVYGSLEEELICNVKNAGITAFDVQFENCVIKAKTYNPAVSFLNCFFNVDPQFVDVDKWNYRLKDGSSLKAAAIPPLFGTNLDDGAPGNIGAY